MRKGAFVMIDALGTRGIWKRHSAESVLQKFAALEASFQARLESELGGPGFPGIKRANNILEEISVLFLSDTIVIAVIPKDDHLAVNELNVAAVTVIIAARFAGIAARMGAEIPPAWSYRGCISFGEIAIQAGRNFFVGEAVDSAAELFEAADGAFTMLAPSASGLLKARFPESEGLVSPLTTWSVPLKGGRSLDTLVVSPFDTETSMSPDNAKKVVANIMGTFNGDALDVVIKKQNTDPWLSSHLRDYDLRYQANSATTASSSSEQK